MHTCMTLTTLTQVKADLPGNREMQNKQCSTRMYLPVTLCRAYWAGRVSFAAVIVAIVANSIIANYCIITVACCTR